MRAASACLGRAAYIWLLNTDTAVQPDTLFRLVAAAEADPGTGMVSPVLYFYSSPQRIQNCGVTVNYRDYVLRDLNSLDDISPDNADRLLLWGTALLINVSVFYKIGLFNEKYFIYGEDMEFSLRALKAGFRTRVVRSAAVRHKSHDYDIKGRQGLPNYFYFYSTRNSLWFWLSQSRGLAKKLAYLGKFLPETFAWLGHHKKELNPEGCRATLDGLICGIFNIGGEWKRKNLVPDCISRILLWHPYLISDIISGKFFKITKSFMGRLKRA